MPAVGLPEILVILLTIGVYVAIGAVIVAVALRLLGVRRKDPRTILEDRLARGEITPAEFHEARRSLEA
jgi:uncharacterized membrane protein